MCTEEVNFADTKNVEEMLCTLTSNKKKERKINNYTRRHTQIDRNWVSEEKFILTMVIQDILP